MKQVIPACFSIVLSATAALGPVLADASDLLPPSRPLPSWAYAATTEPQEITLLHAGIASLQQRLRLIESAQKTIDTEFYIYESDQAGRLYTQALIRKARQGVRVRILIDANFGTKTLNDFDAQQLIALGIDIRFYNRAPLTHFKKANHRNHRKSTIVDGTAAVIGGRNLGDDYFDLSTKYNMLDRDLLVRGSIVRKITESFENFFNSSLTVLPLNPQEPKLADYGLQTETESFYTENQESSAARYKRDRENYFIKRKNAKLLIVTTPEDLKVAERIRIYGDQVLAESSRHICRETYYYSDLPGTSSQSRVVFDQIRNLSLTAQDSIVVESPFFIQNEPANMFQKALNRGVQVDILTNSLYSADVILTMAPFFVTAKTLTAMGANVYVYEGEAPRWIETSNPAAKAARWGTHAKGFTIDKKTIFVGSYNMDPRSENLNAEMALACRNNPDLAADLNLDFDRRKSIAVKLDHNANPVDGRTKFFTVDENKKFMYFLTKPFAFLFESLL